MTARLLIYLLLVVGLTGAPALGADDFGLAVVLLGTGTPNATPDRQGPAVAIIGGGKAYIIDAGTGIVRQAEAARRRHGLEALAPGNLDTAFLTHLHSDHTLGLADLALTPWVLEREKPLSLFGPPGTKKLGDHLIKAYEDDIRIRIDGSQPQNSTGWQIDGREISPGLIFQDDRVSVKAVRACHGEITDSYAFIFRTAARRIVISGDTTYCSAVVEAAKGADILVHELYSDAGFEALSGRWAAYHKSHHTSATDLARLVNQARPGYLVLYHQLSWGGVPEERSLEEITAQTDIPVFYGRDLDLYSAGQLPAGNE